MPLYDYKCQECKYAVKDLVLPIDHEPPKCEDCGRPMVQRLSPPHMRFEGQGWTPNAGIVRRK